MINLLILIYKDYIQYRYRLKVKLIISIEKRNFNHFFLQMKNSDITLKHMPTPCKAQIDKIDKLLHDIVREHAVNQEDLKKRKSAIKHMEKLLKAHVSGMFLLHINIYIYIYIYIFIGLASI